MLFRSMQAIQGVLLALRRVWSLVEARAALERLVGASADWASLDEYLAAYVTEPALRATVYASSFAATLEMVREGVLEVHQHAAFAPLYLRKRTAPANGAAGASAQEHATHGEEEAKG